MDIISKNLGMTEQEPEAKIIKHTPHDVVPAERQTDKDYVYARENLYSILETGTEALKGIVDVAKASDHPEAYKVVAQMIKTMTDANRQLVDMTNTQFETKPPVEEHTTHTTNNNLFVGSTNDLAKMLEDLRNGKQ